MTVALLATEEPISIRNNKHSLSFCLAKDERRGLPSVPGKRERGTCWQGGRHVERVMDRDGTQGQWPEYANSTAYEL